MVLPGPLRLSIPNSFCCVSTGSRRHKVPRAPCRASSALCCASGSPQQPKGSPDVVTLGNLCLDVVLSVDHLPPDDLNTKQRFMEAWMENPTPESTWELGGATNFLLSASRLGLRATSIGHVGGDEFGGFLIEQLRREGIAVHRLEVGAGASQNHSLLTSTLICFVQVDPGHRHAFCSQYDIEKEVLFVDDAPISKETEQLLTGTRSLFVNGYVFDECSPGYILKLCRVVKNSGGALMFDPGPRSFPIMQGTRPGKEALLEMVAMSDVMLMTREEAGAVVGRPPSGDCSERIVGVPGSETKWCVIKDGAQGSLLRTRGASMPVVASGYSVEVADTVGCGDSFGAAIALGYLRGCEPSGVLALANAVGAGTAMRKGAGRNVASRDRIIQILERCSHRGEVRSAMEMIGLAPLST